ncbi:PorT family protein [Hymenobacter sediminis]|uniref:porin family protein n=1 Tax=Hymenobacter sediminis TaxID=2218621 RepID=UPI000DA6A74F|nr:porin family protein [Hymenobacter sediminis]RPD50149.1 PorT family protein [Hymenobacter sediminis]
MFKKHYTPILSAALLLAGAHVAQAQVSIAPRIGLNASSIKFDVEGENPDSKLLYAPQAGVTLNAQFGNLSLQPSLLFSQKGGKFVEKGEESITDDDGKTYKIKGEEKLTFRLSYLEVPVNLVYNTSGEEGGFQVFAGPYIGVGLSGKYKAENEVSVNGEVVEELSGSDEDDIEFVGEGTDENNAELRRIDWGLNAGVGYKSGPFQAQIGYGLGLGNLVPKYDNSDSNDKLHNRGVHFSVAYFFGAK